MIPRHFVAINKTCTKFQFCTFNTFLVMNLFIKMHTDRRGHFHLRPLYCKICLFRLKGQSHKRGPESSRTPVLRITQRFVLKTLLRFSLNLQHFHPNLQRF